MRDETEPPEQPDRRPGAKFGPRITGRLTLPLAGAAARWRAFRENASKRLNAAPESVRLVCAATIAVSLGVGCGLWINARLASATPEPAAAQARPSTVVEADNGEDDAASALTAPVDHGEAVSADSKTDPAAGVGRAEEARRAMNNPARTADDGAGDKRDAIGGASVTPGGASAADESAARGGETTRAGVKSARSAQGGAAPCALNASAGALNIRSGGGASLILGGPGRQGALSVTTPNWSDIAVFREGRAGDKGWIKYSVRSVSGRAGLFAVNVKGPCGSLTIPVTVARP